ncbi:hypothetical protein CU048_12200 [Beijerinckiaceae bacterium]|nr:hypothetical protein CU048_12200 [Beijerinckiaceae bacterium]
MMDSFEGLVLSALEPGECRWPITTDPDGGLRYCAEAVVTNGMAPYCACRLARAYKRPFAGRRFVAAKTADRRELIELAAAV